MIKKYKVQSNDEEAGKKKKSFKTIDEVFAYALETEYTHYNVVFIDNTKPKSK